MCEYEFFPEYELQCHCGKCESGARNMDPAFMEALIELRKLLGPLVITSAYRCPAYNSQISRTGATGPHTTGKAADIACTNGKRRMAIIAAALELGFARIGVARNFIHLDGLTEEDGFSCEVVWVY